MAREDLSGRGSIVRYVQRPDGGYDEVSIVQKPGGQFRSDESGSHFSYSDSFIDEETGDRVRVSGDHSIGSSDDADRESRVNNIVQKVLEKRRMIENGERPENYWD